MKRLTRQELTQRVMDNMAAVKQRENELSMSEFIRKAANANNMSHEDIIRHIISTK